MTAKATETFQINKRPKDNVSETLPDSPCLNLSQSAVHDSYPRGHHVYIRSDLELLSKTELIDIIIEIQPEHDNHDNNHHHNNNHHNHRHRHRHHHHHNDDEHAKRHKKAKTLPFNKKTIHHPHEKTVHRKKATERMATDYDKIEKQRAAIKALKKNRKKAKEHPMDLENICHDEHPHSKTIIHIKATERMATDYDKIEKQRAAIKALKEHRKNVKSNPWDSGSIVHEEHPHSKIVKNIKAKERNPTNYDLIKKKRADIKALKMERKREKLEHDNYLKWRRERAHQKMLGLFNHAHEQKYNYKYIGKLKQNQPRLTMRRERIDNNTLFKANKGKVRVMRDDEVIRFSEEIPIDNFLKAINSGFVKIMNEDQQNEEYFKVTQSAKNMMMENDDISNYQFVITESNLDYDEDDTDSDWDDTDSDHQDDDDEEEEEEDEQYDDDELLEKELLVLNIKTLKKRCKQYRISAHGGKLELISKIIQKKKDTEEK